MIIAIRNYLRLVDVPENNAKKPLEWKLRIRE